ncbi:hypothetical protein [uncultured Dokdonia sp.]|uniref:hypothetical protein n=1 Tax=uncultured Dokdonia sp. TaxID=575653 RepID=UPI002617597D|nr:hypothetical protein [uncultured Dokdonia sp.]
MLERGDILEAKNRQKGAGEHYIIFYAGKDETHFLGGMLSTSEYRGENIPMDRSHFETKDLDEKEYKISYKNSHLVPAKLMKLESWGPFKIVGKLTKGGVKFVENHIDHLDEILWEDYLELRKKAVFKKTKASQPQ